MLRFVIDTNWALNLLVFEDASALPVRHALAAQQIQWVATSRMRDELHRVLSYPVIARRMAAGRLEANRVLAAFDAQVQICEPGARAPVVCRDSDDQIFLDLALAQKGYLLSRDKQVLKTRKRMAQYGVWVGAVLPTELLHPPATAHPSVTSTTSP